MTIAPPKLETFEDHNSDWPTYVDAIYKIFKTDFIYGSPKWVVDNLIVGINSSPISDGKEYTFWHITSTGNIEAERIPDFRRCERIRFPRYLIENFRSGPIYAWEKEVKSGGGSRENRIHIATDDFTYLLVLSPLRKNRRIIITAFYVDSESNRRRLHGDFTKYKIQ